MNNYKKSENANSFGFLPSDETIFERCKAWSEFLSLIVQKEDYHEIYYDELPSRTDTEEDSDTETDENLDDNNCGPLNKLAVAVNKFEASSSSDDDEFNVNDLLNETLPVVEERKRKWKESGMDRIMDSFDLNAITKKVGSWLRTVRMENCMNGDLSIRDAEIMHFEGHQIHLSSDDSMQSADTAKYILSNRKPRAASCTRMTIKRFRYVKSRQKELERKYNYLDTLDMGKDFGEVFRRRGVGCLQAPQTQLRAISNVAAGQSYRSYSSPVRGSTYYNNFMEEPKQTATRRMHKSRYSKRQSTKLRKRSASSSSSDCEGLNSETRPKFRRVGGAVRTKMSRPLINGYRPEASSDSESAQKNHSRASKALRSLVRRYDPLSDHELGPKKGTVTPRLRVSKVPRPLARYYDQQSDSSSDCVLLSSKKATKPLHPASKSLRHSNQSSSSTCELNPHKDTPITSKLMVKVRRMPLKPNDKKPALSTNVSGFLPENIVNSTALANMKPTTTATRTCLLSPIAEKSVHEMSPPPACRPKSKLAKKYRTSGNRKSQEDLPSKQKKEKNISSKISRDSDRKILVYTPENKSLYTDSIQNGSFILTEEHLQRSIGKRAAQRFIKFNVRKFPWKFDSSSTVYFMPPTESENSHRSGSNGDSDEDILNMFGKQGELVEQRNRD